MTARLRDIMSCHHHVTSMLDSELEQNGCDARSCKRACTTVQAVPAEGYMASCAFISINSQEVMKVNNTIIIIIIHDDL